MPKKSLIQKFLHAISGVLPNSFLCIFGNCKSACGSMCLEDDINDIKSTKLKLHMSFCRKCWNYYQQMKIVNERICTTIESDVNTAYDSSKEKKSVQDLVSKFSRS